ncbi:MAG: hypothetical protein IH991_11840, partial [Planctomycetes bacterium]|nr:hypothetical protein [Planctomycetota bacterium]
QFVLKWIRENYEVGASIYDKNIPLCQDEQVIQHCLDSYHSTTALRFTMGLPSNEREHALLALQNGVVDELAKYGLTTRKIYYIGGVRTGSSVVTEKAFGKIQWGGQELWEQLPS